MTIKDLPPVIKTAESEAGAWSQLIDWLNLVWKFVRTPALVINASGDAPTTPTGAPGDSSLQIANDAFVQQELAKASTLSAMYGMSGVEGVLTTYPQPPQQSMYGSRNLRGTVNAVSPLTKYDLTSADFLILTNSTGNAALFSSVGLITNDLGLAGITPNGRDQVAVFPVSSWVYIYYIWNGTTLATISSLSPPPTGPALPTGYTYWCFATAVRWNASSNVVPGFTRGCQFYYDVASYGAGSVLSGGTSTTFVTVSCSAVTPPISSVLYLACLNGGSSAGLLLRPTGSSITGQYVAFASQQFNTILFPLGTSTSIDYKVYAGASGTLDVFGYNLPNGGC